ncbi:terpene synthase family protein [Catenulispora pinisilvae]|uniref:terpene synthase family protein n=1 Tax=Catenulispora pinisilvae TaxID=2705253 RepID=UPI001891A44A|nr:hypothetical protein [Catenulispora pinisilvae]
MATMSLPDPVASAVAGAATLQVTRSLQRWATRFPAVVDPDLVLPVALTHTFCSPWLKPHELLPGCRTALWVFHIDDIVERAPLDVPRLLDIATGAAPDPGSSTEIVLAELREELAARPLFETVGGLWSSTLDRLLTGLMWERDTALARAAGAPEPSVAEYLEHAFTIGSAFVRSSIWLASESTDLLPQLEALTAAMSEAVVAVRLANDLATYKRELGEPASLNILMLQGIDEPWVHSEIRQRRARCAKILAPVIQESNAAAGVLRLIDYTTTFYLNTDYRPSE